MSNDNLPVLKVYEVPNYVCAACSGNMGFDTSRESGWPQSVYIYCGYVQCEYVNIKIKIELKRAYGERV